jgi:hypothetical protein
MVVHMATFRELLYGRPGRTFAGITIPGRDPIVHADDQPFMYYKYSHGDDGSWTNGGNTLYLGDADFTGTSGYLYLMVKPGWEADFLIRTENFGFFGDDDLSDYSVKSWNIEQDSPDTALQGFSSSLKITLRGMSMMAVVVDGEAGQWGASTRNDPFRVEANHRNIEEPNAGNNGIMFSLTFPNGDQTENDTQYITFNDPDDETDITLLSYRYVGFQQGGQVQEGTGGQHAPQLPNIYGPEVIVGTGETVDGNTWKVGVRLNKETEEHAVFVNGTIHSEWPTVEEAFEIAEGQVEVQKELAKVKLPTKPEGDEWDDIVDDGLGWVKILLFVAVGALVIYGLRTVALFLPKKASGE